MSLMNLYLIGIPFAFALSIWKLSEPRPRNKWHWLGIIVVSGVVSGLSFMVLVVMAMDFFYQKRNRHHAQ